mmetsp:Transcript_53379/g.114750  ORF Transcript_53379/g.114750 Transcript_53379/m.114750 type:complete len:282 (-) Transcript_53379:114-959(-)
MGTFAKRLGQLSARSLESESKNILRTSAANKLPGSLSLALDGTLKRGHDMRVFGMGTAASMANRARYARFTTSMHAVYAAMEEELDLTAKAEASPASAVWRRHGPTLRREAALRADLEDVVGSSGGVALTPATERYVAGIRAAAADDRACGGARILGHLYCRYFADLFGGQMLATPTRLALSLEAGTPRHYYFQLPSEEAQEGVSVGRGGRRAYIEDVYRGLNAAGEMLTPSAFDAVVDEAMLAFGYNVGVYSEEPMLLDALRGSVNVCTGYLSQTLGRRT